MKIFSQNINNLFIKTFDETYDSLYHYAVSFINDQDSAKDIVHDAFVYAWNNKENLDFSKSIKPYLLKIVRNYSLNHIRNRDIRKKHESFLINELDHNYSIDYEEHDQTIKKITKVIDNLPHQCKTVFKLNIYEGKKYREIAEELDISINTVKTHISKALKTLRTEIGEKAILLLILTRTTK